jgi:hypothetical protein
MGPQKVARASLPTSYSSPMGLGDLEYLCTRTLAATEPPRRLLFSIPQDGNLQPRPRRQRHERLQGTRSSPILVHLYFLASRNQDSDRFVRGPQVVVPPHPLISHWVSVIRDHSTPTHSFSKFFLGPNSIVGLVSNVYKFRFMVCNFFACWSTSWAGSAMGELGRLLAYEATRDWLVYS